VNNKQCAIKWQVVLEHARKPRSSSNRLKPMVSAQGVSDI